MFVVFFILSLFVCPTLYAAGAPSFNYEVHEHHGLVAPLGLNRALVHYDYPQIVARNGVIPAVGPGAHQLGISLSMQLAGLQPWQHSLNMLCAPLNLQEACQMAIDRQSIGITVRFEHPLLIALVAAGFPAGAVAAFLGIPAGYLNQALSGGGYLTPMATTIYRFRHNLPHPNFAILPIPAPPLPAVIADSVIIHIHEPRRVSKNVKELSLNSTLNPGLAGMPPYISIKDMIDIQIVFLGVAPPDNATILSADFLQLN